jgi:hypothetical protein
MPELREKVLASDLQKRDDNRLIDNRDTPNISFEWTANQRISYRKTRVVMKLFAPPLNSGVGRLALSSMRR